MDLSQTSRLRTFQTIAVILKWVYLLSDKNQQVPKN